MMNALFLIETKIHTRESGDGFAYDTRRLTPAEVVHFTAHVADDEHPVSAIVRLPEMTEAT